MDSQTLAQISNEDLLQELKTRFAQKDKALNDLKTMNEKLDLAHSRLLDADKLKSHFLGVIRNEFKNPLGAILGLARMLAGKKIKTKAEIAKAAETILMEAHTLSFQLDNVLEAALLEAGEQQLVMQVVDLSEIVKDTVHEHQYNIRGKNLKVTTAMEDGQQATGDGQKIKVVVTNLVSNAIKFSQSNGNIHIVLEPNNEGIAFSVTDEGEGINEEDARVIFERFKQADMGMARKHTGAGLGLSVASALLELHGGKIWYEPRPNGGTVFHATLPNANEEQHFIYNTDQDNTTDGDALLF